MGKMKELIGIAEAFENAVNYSVGIGSGMKIEEILEVESALSDSEKDEILDGWKSDFHFIEGELRRFINAHPEYELINEIEILAPDGADNGDCWTAKDFIAFCEKH